MRKWSGEDCGTLDYMDMDIDIILVHKTFSHTYLNILIAPSMSVTIVTESYITYYI